MPTRKLTLGIDLDGVCADYVGYVLRRYRDADLGDYTHEDVNRYDALPDLGGFKTADEMFAFLDQDPHRWTALGPIPGARASLQALSSQGHEIVFITARPKEAALDTRHWLVLHGLGDHELHVVSDKTTVARCDVYLDDTEHHLYSLAKAFPDSKVVRFARPWNKGYLSLHGRTSTVETWSEFIALVQDAANCPRISEVQDGLNRARARQTPPYPEYEGLDAIHRERAAQGKTASSQGIVGAIPKKDRGTDHPIFAEAWAKVRESIQKHPTVTDLLTVDLSTEDRAREACGLSSDDGRPVDEEERVTDPKTGGQKGRKMAQLGAIDPTAILEVAKVAGFGASKYARYNYLKGYDWSLSFDALQRHMLQFWSGEDDDPESGRPHLAHAAWHAIALLSFGLHDLGTDDRPSTVL